MQKTFNHSKKAHAPVRGCRFCTLLGLWIPIDSGTDWGILDRWIETPPAPFRYDLARSFLSGIWSAIPKVFISYSHDSETHKARVAALSKRLRDDGIDCMIDQYVASPPEGWTLWMQRQLEESRFVLIICTEVAGLG